MVNLKCIDECLGIKYNGSNYHNCLWCWPYPYNKTIEIYVHPASPEPIEFGTWLYPFKTIQRALVDLNFNINNRTDVDVILWIAEKSRIELLSYSFFVENLNSFTISSYSLDGRVTNKESDYSILSVTDIPRVVASQRTLFFLMANPTLANIRTWLFATQGSERNGVALRAHMTFAKVNV